MGVTGHSRISLVCRFVIVLTDHLDALPTNHLLEFRDFNTAPPPFQMKLPQIQKIMMEFEKQSEIMDMKEEMMNDAIDDAMGDEDDEEER